ncbi:hypothetical protein MXB_5186 [Myxobolus squamalis]|nr:hypothetical protein MXB_5186 [Myxobolus squamalis]
MCFRKNLENVIYYSEFNDTELFSETEIIIPKTSLTEYQGFETLAKNHSILVSKVKLGPYLCLNSDNYKTPIGFKAFSDLIDNESIPTLHKSYILVNISSLNVYNCLSVLISYLKVLPCFVTLETLSENKSKYMLSNFDRSDFMCLDGAAIKSLSIFPDIDISNNSSLFGLLNTCKTKQGQRLLATWVRQPLRNKIQLEARLNMVEYFVDSFNFALEIRSLPDLSLLVSKLFKSRAGILDCVKIYFAIKKMKIILNLFDNHRVKFTVNSTVETLILQPLEYNLKETDKYSFMIESMVNLNVGMGEEYNIRDDVDDNLKQIQTNIQEIEAKIDIHVEKICQKIGLELGKSIKKEYSHRRGYFFRVTIKFCHMIDEAKFQILETLKDGVHFVDEKMKEYSDELCSLQKEYQSFQSRFIADMVNVASLSSLPASTCRQYTRPQILNSDEGVISIQNGRHPCMEELSSDLVFIPNDLELNKKDKFFLIITGPNMGGKSTYLRQCAVIILMAQIGSFVPCERAKISLVDKIITRVGASDYQLNGLSTFMAEMVDASSILRSATENSFVIVDELGRGTSTYDGFGLGWSIAE